MDFIFKDENIKAGKIENAEFECSSLDANCDGEDLGKGDMDDGAFVIALDENDTVAEITVGGTKGDEALVVEDIEDFSEQQGGGKKKKKKNRSRSKKNKKKRKRKNSTKKKN